MRAQLLINMIIKWVSKICELVPYTDINPLLRRQLELLNVLIYDSQAVWPSNFYNFYSKMNDPSKWHEAKLFMS